MAKILKNENESPEVDLKNLTVKLAGMGLDEEIEDVIPGKKDKKGKKDSSEEESSEAAQKDEAETAASDDVEDTEAEAEDAEAEADETETSEDEGSDVDLDETEEVAEFYEKRAAERDLTLDKVEALAEEMEATDGEKKQKVGVLDTVIGKPEKKESTEETSGKKKAHFDAVAIIGIVAAILALIGGAIYIFFQVYEEPNLGVTEKEFRLHYYETAIYKGIIAYGFAMPLPTYRDEVADPTTVAGETTAAAVADPTAVTTAEKSKYRYYDGVMNNALYIPIYITGKECRSNDMLKQLRFFAPCETEDEKKTVRVAFAAFLQAFYVGEDSQTCADKVVNAYNQSLASANQAIMVKDGDIAYAVSYNSIDGIPCLVLDIVPAKEADDFVFYNSIFG